MQLLFLATWAHLIMIMTAHDQHAVHQAFPTKLPTSQVVDCLYCHTGLLHPRYSIIHLLLLNSVQFLWSHFYSLSWPTWTVVLHPTVPSNLLSSTNLLGVHSIPSLKFLKKLYSIDPNVGTTDVTNNWFLFRLCAIDHIPNSLVSFQPLCCSLRQPVSH